MHRPALTLLSTLAILAGTAGWPAPAHAKADFGMFQLGGSSELASIIKDLEKYVDEGDRSMADTYMNKLGMEVKGHVSAMGKADYEAAMAARTKAAKAGIEIGGWGPRWDYDDQEMSDKDKKVADVVDEALYSGYHEGGSSVSDRHLQETIDKVSEMVGRDLFKRSENLKFYLDNIAGPSLYGLIYTLDARRIERIEQIYNALMRSAGNDAQATNYSLVEASEYFAAIAKSGIDFDDSEIKAKPDDKLDDSVITLKGVRAKFAEIAKKNAKVLALQKKAEDALLKKWKTLLKADKAGLYTKFGQPENFEVTMSGWQPEDAAKSSWWTYYERATQNYWWRNLYTFNGSQKLIKTERTIVYNPTGR